MGYHSSSRGHFIRSLFLWAASYFLFLAHTSLDASETLPQGMGIPVLLYHGITEEYDPQKVYTISQKQFKQHLGALKLAGYQTVSIKDLYFYFYYQKSLPAKAVMITFDDGRKESFEMADRILEEYDFKAVMFVNTLMQEKEFPGYLSWHELKKMHRSGRWDIQAHGYEYHNLIPINAQGDLANFGSNLKWLKDEERYETLKEFQARLTKDLLKQKEQIESHITGERVVAFSYPFGDWGGGSQTLNSSLAIAINYQAVNEVFPLSFGNVEFDAEKYDLTSTPHIIVRLMDNGDISPQELVQILDKAS